MRYEEPSLTVLGSASEMIQAAGIHKKSSAADGNGQDHTSTGSFYDMDE